ncbi:MAG: hypothetical protein JWP25_103 [Bradyrhizobium sp.]|jgi:hypothetical protein|nr:hypothetical protein [Bradyrhizobium sp.]
MDECKPSIPPSEFRLQSASEWTSAEPDPPPAELTKSHKLVALERQSRSGQIDPPRNDIADGASVVLYYKDEEEVSQGFLVALSAMGVALIEEVPESAKPPVRGAKP